MCIKDRKFMEVHHKHHAPRSIKEYVTEFLMLFTAVTLGFFVENIREHYIEDQRGITYATRLAEDIKEDSARLDRVYKSAEEKVKLISSIAHLAENESTLKQFVDSFYYFNFWNYNSYGHVSNLPRFYRVEETIEELKAGNLRLIKSDSVISNLTAYSRRYNILNQTIDDYWQERAMGLSLLHNEMFDKTYYYLHYKDHPRTFPIVYRALTKENIYKLKTELLAYRINMESLNLNIRSLQLINQRLSKNLELYINQ
ncbi:MAG: hypothetical protein EBV71_01750 [Chitinophagia bacterium]|jgi:hypothetical protein|nr:hypothetical protein [Chitinophagia bacterium]